MKKETVVWRRGLLVVPDIVHLLLNSMQVQSTQPNEVSDSIPCALIKALSSSKIRRTATSAFSSMGGVYIAIWAGLIEGLYLE